MSTPSRYSPPFAFDDSPNDTEGNRTDPELAPAFRTLSLGSPIGAGRSQVNAANGSRSQLLSPFTATTQYQAPNRGRGTGSHTQTMRPRILTQEMAAPWLNEHTVPLRGIKFLTPSCICTGDHTSPCRMAATTVRRTVDSPLQVSHPNGISPRDMNLLYLGQVIVAQQTASTGFKVGIPTAVYTRLVSAFRAAAGASNMITMFDTEQSGYNWVTIYLPSAQPQMVRFATGEEMDLAQLPYTYPGHNFVGNISVSVICRSEHSTNPRLNPVYSPIFVFNTIDCLKWTDIMQPEE